MSDTPREPDLTAARRDLHAMVRVRLSRHDHRYTHGRRRLVEALAGAGHPMTLAEIASVAPDLPVSSTYRNLEVLERSGVVNRISIRGDRAHFELAEPLLSHHHHLVCVACGTIEDIHLDDELEDLVDRNLAEAARRAAFTPLRHLLDLHGHCSACEPPGRYLRESGWSGKNEYQFSAPSADHTTNREFAMGHVHTDACYDHPEHTHADHADHCGMQEHSHADHADHCGMQEHSHADHADHCGMEEHSHADHCDDDHDHGDHCDIQEHSHADHADHCDLPEHSHADHADHCDLPEHSHADHADHCDMEEHTHTEECCIAA